MLRVAQITILFLAGLKLSLCSVDVSGLKRLPSADLNSGLGYELLVAAIESMQQDILETRQQVSEQQESTSQMQRQLLAAQAEIDRKQQTMESKIQEMLKRSLVELRQQIQTSLQTDSSPVKQIQQSVEQLRNRTEKSIGELKQTTKKALEDQEKRFQAKITELQSKATLTRFERPADNRIYDSCIKSQISGIVRIRPPNTGIPSFQVLCHQNNWGSWMVVHRRFNGSLDFNRKQFEYRHGFGQMDSEYWLGLEKMHAITSSNSYELLIVMKRSDGTSWYAHYQQIVVGSRAEKYKLQLSGFYRGSVADSMAPSNGMAFSTPDNDNDMVPEGNCAQQYSSGWWFNQCFHANLNGIYGRGRTDNTMQWNGFGDKECLLEAMMMIRPSQGDSGAIMPNVDTFQYYSQHFSSSSSRNGFPLTGGGLT